MEKKQQMFPLYLWQNLGQDTRHKIRKTFLELVKVLFQTKLMQMTRVDGIGEI